MGYLCNKKINYIVHWISLKCSFEKKNNMIFAIKGVPLLPETKLFSSDVVEADSLPDHRTNETTVHRLDFRENVKQVERPISVRGIYVAPGKFSGSKDCPLCLHHFIFTCCQP